MGLIFNKIKLSSFLNDEFLRLDEKYRVFADVQKYKAWDISNCYSLSFALKELSSPKLKKGELEDEYILIDLANIERRGNSIVNAERINEIGSDKSLLKNGDIVIPKMEPKKGQFFLNTQHNEYLGSTELVEYEINKNNFNPLFLYYLLVNPCFLSVLACLESGKTHKRVNSSDLLKIQIPKVSIEIQDAIAEKIAILETKIITLKNSKLKPIDIINQVIGEAFCFDWNAFEKIKSKRQFIATFTDFSKNVDCRFSYKFHNQAGQFIYDFLCSKTKTRIKHFISEPIVLGKSVSPSNYDDEGEFYYIAMSNIKTWAFDPEGCKKVSENYSSANPNKTVKKDDILLARSGEGTIGKVALIEDEDIQGIFADFTQRIRLKNYNHRLAYYYFRSDFFQYLVYTHKKGLGNNTNIFPSQIQEFPIPDWTEEKQAEIVKKIQTQIDAQSHIDREIEKNRAKINLIIEEAIRNPANV
ncbi:MAG: restriction endonuclease subunit S [Methylococcaceae bacterium]